MDHVLNEKEIRRAKAIADPVAPIMLVYTDIACKSGPLHTPSWLRAEFFPLVKKLVDVYHERGVKCIYHSDGNLNPVMEDLVATGIDGINPLETLAGMAVSDARARFPRLAIAGSIDVSQLLTLGTPTRSGRSAVGNRRNRRRGSSWVPHGASSRREGGERAGHGRDGRGRRTGPDLRRL